MRNEAAAMRLTAEEIRAIKDGAREAFGVATVVRLFGSRVDDSVRGGDINLHFEIDDGQQRVENAAAFRWRLPPRLSERRLDLVFRVRGAALCPIDEAAYDQGVIL
jgi:hypothetical protein